MGRPALYTPELAARILDRLAEGERLAVICEDDDMPSRGLVHAWVVSKKPEHAGFGEAYLLARKAGVLGMADEVIEIADDTSGDRKWVGRDGEEREVVDSEFVMRSKLRVDTRKFIMSKFAPEVFGDSISVGGVPDKPIEVKDVSRNDVARRIAFALMGKQGDK